LELAIMLNIIETVLPAIRQTVDAGTPLPAIVDALADVQTAIASLEALERNLKAQLIASGLQEVCGSNVRAVVSTIAQSTAVDYRAIVASLKLDQSLLDAFRKPKAGYTAVKLYGYN
jgi:hypothetical protein